MKTIDLIDLNDKLSMKIIAEKLNEIISALGEVQSTKPRNRGPLSERIMDDNDARRILIGDLKDVGHKEAGEILKLSYGQIYSCRKCFTFKHIHQEIKNSI